MTEGTLGQHHTIHAGHRHFGWSRDYPSAQTVAPGDTVELEIVDGGGGQVTPDSSPETLATLDFDTLLPLTGPIFVDSAKPGDTLKVSILNFEPSGWGWSGVIPGYGILPSEFPDALLKSWHYDPSGAEPALFGDLARIPIRPFAGTLGVAPATPGVLSAIPPRPVGGNLDVRDLVAGVDLYLPIAVDGALFSVGDTHAAQGDGELAGSAIESSMSAAFRFEVLKTQTTDGPWFTTPGPVSRHLDAAGYHVALGVNESLMEAAKDAVRRMIDVLGGEHGLRPEDAYLLLSVCADLRINQLVNQPVWTVGLYFPLAVLS